VANETREHPPQCVVANQLMVYQCRCRVDADQDISYRAARLMEFLELPCKARADPD